MPQTFFLRIQFRRFFSGNDIFAKIGSKDFYACGILIFESMNEQGLKHHK